MSGFFIAGVRAVSLILLVTPAGCRSTSTVTTVSNSIMGTVVEGEGATAEPDAVAQNELPSVQVDQTGIQPTALEEPEIADSDDSAEPLSLAWLVNEVLRQNPNRQAAIAAWQAAAQRYPQVTALDDPMLQTAIGPRGLASDQVNGAYMVGISQKVPWTGKRELRGDQSLWEQTAAQWDTADVTLRLTEATRLAYYDYYLVARKLGVIQESGERLRAFRATARSKYETGQVTQQDVLQTDVELGQLDRRRIELVRERRIAMARINTLLHRRPESPLPEAPLDLPAVDAVPESTVLSDLATQARPDLLAMSARIQAERTSIELARKEFYPDLEFMGRYDAFWQEKPLRPMIGMNLNIPLNQTRRQAAVDEATFRYNKMCAEYAAAVDNLRNDIQAAWERLEASRQSLSLFDQSILPSSEQNIAAAEAGYVAGNVDYLRLIEAQRQTIELREQRYQLVAEYHSRIAELERLVGRPVTEAITP